MSFNKPRTTLYCLTCNKAFKLHLTEKKNRMNHGNGRIKVKWDLRIKNWTELKKKIKVWKTLIISELHHHYSFCCDNNCKYLVWNDYSMLLNWSSQPYNTSAFHSAGRPFFDGFIFAFFWVFLRVVPHRVGKATC